MYSQWGIIDGREFTANSTAVRAKNQLVALKADGKVTPDTGIDNVYFPVKQAVAPANEGEIVDVQITGVAKVYVETATSIVAGATVIVGPNGLGVIFGALPGAQPSADAYILGIAMEAAAGKTHIAVLLQQMTFIEPA